MLRAFNAGISGMTANQTKLDVTSGNIANSSTVGYKSESVNCSDTFSETISDATGASKNLGGTNSKQITLGTQVSSISTNIQKGSLNTTGRNLDCAIDGQGQYFIVATGPTMFGEADCVKIDSNKHAITTVPTGTSISYTRDGGFQLDSEGNLLTSDGHRVLGYSMIGRNQLGSGASYGDVVSISRNQGENTINATTGINKDSSVITADHANSIDAANSAIISRQSAVTTKGESSYVAEGDVAFVDYDANDLRADSGNLHSLRIPNSVKKIYTDSKGMHVKSVKIKGFSIGKEGIITATLDDNTTAALGQIAMATFKNPEGLTKSGSNLLDVSSNSGPAIIRYGAAKEIKGQTAYNNSIKIKDNSAGYNSVIGGALEESNVDLAKEFTNMIVATRAFQASSKVISNGDEVLQTLVNLVK